MSSINWLSLFYYDREKGELYWTNPPQPNTKRLKGKLAGTINRDGYLNVTHMKQGFRVHRIIWYLEKGYWPERVIDHIDGNKLNNKISNLRECSHTENMRNTYRHRAGKLLGTGYHKQHQKWRAFMRRDGRQIQLGMFNSEIEAHQAYLRAVNGD